jgi:uncharacterized phage-like protein YoqJ
MGRPALTPEQKLVSIQRRKETKKLWNENNQERYKEVLHDWYIANKEKLYERKKELRMMRKLAKNATPEKID